MQDAPAEAHEQMEHAMHAEHATSPFVSRVTITIASLAVLAAVAGSLETLERGEAIIAANSAVLDQDRATDSWNLYEGRSIKKYMRDLASGGSGPEGSRGYGQAAGDAARPRSGRQRNARAPPSQFDDRHDADRDGHCAVDRRHHHPADLAMDVGTACWRLRYADRSAGLSRLTHALACRLLRKPAAAGTLLGHGSDRVLTLLQLRDHRLSVLVLGAERHLIPCLELREIDTALNVIGPTIVDVDLAGGDIDALNGAADVAPCQGKRRTQHHHRSRKRESSDCPCSNSHVYTRRRRAPVNDTLQLD